MRLQDDSPSPVHLTGLRHNVELKARDPDQARSLATCEDIGAASQEIDQPEELKAALRSALGLKAVVKKKRWLFLWEGVRIHLDQVTGLDAFIEFEAIADAPSDLSHQEAQVARLRQAFGIEDADLVGASYCDLVSERTS